MHVPNRITLRVALLSVAVALLLSGGLAVLIVAVQAQREAAAGAFRSQQALTAGSELEKSLISIDNGLRGYVASGRPRFLEPADRAMAAYPAQIERLETLLSSYEQRVAMAQITAQIDDYVNLWARPLIALADTRLADAQSVIASRTGRQRLESIRIQFADLFQRENEVTRERAADAERRADVAIGVGLLGLLFIVAVAASLAVFLQRSVVRPVLEVAGATRRLASGQLSTRLPVERNDELGDLARSFNTMAGSLEANRRQLAARTEALERSNAELEQFASITSHDLQAPLVTISMYAGLLERQRASIPESGEQYLDGIRGATRQAREMIRALLEFSRAGRGAPELEPFPAGRIVGKALEALRGDIDASGAHIVVGELPVVLAEPANLCRVFQNLIGNALKFTRDGEAPHVLVSAERRGDEWVFSVADSGIGMEAEHFERIFQPFQRLHGEADYPGTGIGLAVCQRIVAQHGGRIWVTSRPGEGSTFSFTLPVAALPEPGDAPVEPPLGAAA